MYPPHLKNQTRKKMRKRMTRKMKQLLTPVLRGEIRENELMGGALCCDMSQYDTIGKIELIPAFVLSTDKTNC